MIDFIKGMLVGIASLYFTVFIVLFAIGTTEANRGKWYSDCHTKMSKIEYIIPAYRLGCWANKRPTE